MSRCVFRTTFQTIYLLYTCTCSDIVSFNQNTPVWHVTEKGFNPGNLPVKQELRNAKVLIHSQIHEIPCLQVCTPRGVEQWFHPFVIVNPFWSALPGVQIYFLCVPGANVQPNLHNHFKFKIKEISDTDCPMKTLRFNFLYSCKPVSLRLYPKNDTIHKNMHQKYHSPPTWHFGNVALSLTVNIVLDRINYYYR